MKVLIAVLVILVVTLTVVCIYNPVAMIMAKIIVPIFIIPMSIIGFGMYCGVKLKEKEKYLNITSILAAIIFYSVLPVVLTSEISAVKNSWHTIFSHLGEYSQLIVICLYGFIWLFVAGIFFSLSPCNSGRCPLKKDEA